MKNAIKLGNCTYALTAKEIVINRNEETGNTLSLTYETPEEQALATLPAIGSKTSLLKGVILDKASISHGEAGIATVKLDYVKDVVDEDDEDSGSDEEGTIVEQTLDGSVTDEPILTHSLCKKLNAAAVIYLKAIQDGTPMWEEVPELNSDGSPIMDGDKPKKKSLNELTAKHTTKAGIVLDLVKKGVQSYRSPSATWTERRVVKGQLSGSGIGTPLKPSIDVSGVGKISKPTDAPTPKGRNWLLVGKNLSSNGDGTWTQTSVWEMSGPDGWDESLYGG